MGFLTKEKWRFEGARFMESTAHLQGMACGFYHLYPFALEKEPDYEELYWCLYEREALVHVVINIGAFKKAEIPKETLQRLHQILVFFTRHQKEMILRVVYDREGSGLLKEPDTIGQVELHMRQLGPLLQSFQGQIVVVQGLLIGSWGEMHDSRFLSREKLRRLFSVWREALGAEIPIAVRTPLQWRLLHEEGILPGTTLVGIFNDGMFGSPVDLGTYGVKSRKDARWEESWCREDELRFIRKISRRVPYGGEAVGLSEEGTLKQAVKEMAYTGVSYLNAAHDIKRLEQWKQTPWQEKGIWHGISGYDYIGAHMGPRPVMRRVSGKIRESVLELEYFMENVGFASFYEVVELVLEQRLETQVLQSRVMEVPFHHIRPGQTLACACQLPLTAGQGEYGLYVQLRRQRDKKILRFANRGAKEWLFSGSLRYL